MNEKTVEINGTVYDKITGMPIRRTDAAPLKQRSHAATVHRKLQKSTTLNRNYVQRQTVTQVPVAQPKVTSIPVKEAAHEAIRSPMIQKYAKHPVATKSAPRRKPHESLSPPAVHPMVQQVHAARQTKQQPIKKVPKPSDIIKAEAIQTALDSAPTSHPKQRAPRRPKQRTNKYLFGRAFSFASSGVALLLIAGYFTYMNMPNLSVRVAAVQAGVQADYPGYRPSGYSLAGPVSFDEGRVAMNFGSNGTDRAFTLTQTRSGWDSAAVYENYVAPRVDDSGNYTTTTSGGLTIYSWSGNAAWVNNGVLYTVDGDAPLTPDQIQRMATSL